MAAHSFLRRSGRPLPRRTVAIIVVQERLAAYGRDQPHHMLALKGCALIFALCQQLHTMIDGTWPWLAAPALFWAVISVLVGGWLLYSALNHRSQPLTSRRPVRDRDFLE